jgi:hypothetical protein
MPAPTPPTRDWVLVYYMSYDNDLAPHATTILPALECGVKNSDLLVTVLQDDKATKGLKRHTLSAEAHDITLLATDNSASESVLGDYLAWVAEHYPARHYALCFLDHGGNLDEMCLDESPGQGETKHWLSAQLSGSVIRQFCAATDGKLELLFLQQCGRGTVENLYNFRGTAATIMASPLKVGAPNTYYAATLRWLAANKTATGLELARQIMANDTDFSLYVCVDGAMLDELPNALAPVVAELLRDGKTPLPATGIEPCFRHGNECNYDLSAWLEAAFQQNGGDLQALAPFKTWLQQRLIVALAHHNSQASTDLCGLALFEPASAWAFGQYRDYPVYRETALGELWRKVYATPSE